MILRISFLLTVFFGSVFADVRIESPKHHQVTNQSTIDFVFSSSVDTGFIMLKDLMIPIRKNTRVDNIELRLGMNHWRVYVLNNELQLQPNLTREINIYRQLSIRDGIQNEEARVLTDLVANHYIHVLDGGLAKMDQPILKKDVYGFLMWFYRHQTRRPVFRRYGDMAAYSNYVTLFELKPQVLPLPRLGSFYPNAYVTREAFVNLLLLLNGSSDQISTSMLVNDQLMIPQSLRYIIPKTWTEPLAFVTRREVLKVYFNLFHEQALPEERVVSIDWPLFDPQQVIQKPMTYLDMVRDIKLAFMKRWRTIQVARAQRRVNQSLASKKNMGPAVSKGVLPNPSSLTIVVVQPGDSIQKIARRYYGNSSKWKQLVYVNQLNIHSVTVNGHVVSSVHIEPGQRLRLL